MLFKISCHGSILENQTCSYNVKRNVWCFIAGCNLIHSRCILNITLINIILTRLHTTFIVFISLKRRSFYRQIHIPLRWRDVLRLSSLCPKWSKCQVVLSEWCKSATFDFSCAYATCVCVYFAQIVQFPFTPPFRLQFAVRSHYHAPVVYFVHSYCFSSEGRIFWYFTNNKF